MTNRVFAGGDVIIDGAIRRADVTVADGQITAIGEHVPAGHADTEVVACAGLIVAPGFIDLQCNGANGVDLTSEPQRIGDVSRELPRFGVTAYLPAIVTAPEPTRRAALSSMAAVGQSGWTAGSGARPLGVHFEGPAISLDHLGAHVGRFTGIPNGEELGNWIESGCVRLVTVAPEIDGAGPMIERLASAGIAVSAGHTAMSPADLAAARRRGVTYVTHLFNAMAPFGHRAPGPIGATLADDGVVAGLICDGLHVDPIAVRMAWNALGPARTSLVSDASAALGAPFGSFRLGTFEVTHDERGVRTTSGVLAGSALALDQAVRNLIAFAGCDLVDAVATVTSTPADLLGLTDRGRLRVGNHADLTILDPDGALVATVVAGTTEWSGPSAPGPT